MDPSGSLLYLTVEVVSAYIAQNPTKSDDVPGLIRDVHNTIQRMDAPFVSDDLEPSATPAVPVETSVNDDFIICLEDGKRFKTLRRHLWASFGMTPEQYRSKWKLPQSYPMVAPGYSRRRSALAQETGLGKRRAKA